MEKKNGVLAFMTLVENDVKASCQLMHGDDLFLLWGRFKDYPYVPLSPGYELKSEVEKQSRLLVSRTRGN